MCDILKYAMLYALIFIIVGPALKYIYYQFQQCKKFFLKKSLKFKGLAKFLLFWGFIPKLIFTLFTKALSKIHFLICLILCHFYTLIIIL